MYDEFVLPLRFMPKDGTLDALRRAAAEIDNMGGLPSDEDEQSGWTFAQAITVVLHQAPERLHEFLDGWSIETSWDDLAVMPSNWEPV